MSDQKTAMGGEFLGDLGAAVRANPLPAALIGMGLTWLLAGGRASVQAGFGGAVEAATGLGSRLGETARDVGRSVGGAVTSAAGDLRGSGAAAAQNVSDAASSLTSSARKAAPTINSDFFAAARSNFTSLVERQPLLLGAIGLSIGAAVAASLRPSAAEVDLLGDASAGLQDHARKIATEVAQRAAVVADGLTTTVAEEARVQGLTSDGLRQRAADATRKIGSAIDESAQRVRSRIN
jgi:hypothetical protein